MAKRPLKRRRAASPPPRKATDGWHVNLANLLGPLTPTQKRTLDAIFGLSKAGDWQQLQQDWKRISEVAHYVALKTQTKHDSARLLLNDRDIRNRRDAQLRKATTAADAAAKALKEMVTLWSKHVDAPGHQAALATWANTVTATLAQQREAIEQYRTRARKWPRVPVKRGKPEEPVTYRLKVLAAYFRHHGWEVSSKAGSLFTQTCSAVTTGSLKPINPTLLKTVVTFHDSYPTLDAKAPPILEKDRRLHLAWARKKTTALRLVSASTT